jgi:hypothetical protein
MDILPIDLIPCVLRQLSSPNDLASTCRVNRVFLTFSIPILYEKISVQAWHQQSKLRVGMLLPYLGTFRLIYALR